MKRFINEWKNRLFFWRNPDLLLSLKKGLAGGLGILIGIGIGTIALYAVSVTINTFSSGTSISSVKINENFANIKTALETINDPPIGSIVAWHESMSGVPSLPAGWVRCNGQTLSDSLSPLNGQVIPNLNTPKNPWNSKGSFLRGSATSGLMEDDSFQGHWHQSFVGNINTAGGSFERNGVTASTSTIENLTQSPKSDGVNGTPRTASETRSVNMSVVWIMRVR